MPEAIGLGKYRDNSAKQANPTPDFLIKWDPVNEPAAIGGNEEHVCGTEADAIEQVQRLIESGRTTPARVRIFANVQAIIQTSVSFPPSTSRPR